MSAKLSTLTQSLLLILLALAFSGMAQPIAQAQSGDSVRVPLPLWAPSSPFNTLLPEDAQYVQEDRIGAFRQGYDEWSMPIYRLASGENVPLVTVINRYSDRTEVWPIPIEAEPAPADDAHMAVIVPGEGMLYEFWDAVWLDESTIEAGGMVSFPLDGPGISNPPYYRVTAAGFAVMAGMVIEEDFLNAETGQLDPAQTIDHALTMSLPFDLVMGNGYLAPAVGGESQGTAGLEGIPMGALYAILPDVDVDGLEIHPFARELLRAARDYGIYVRDTNGSDLFNDKYVGTIRVEPGLIEALYSTPYEDMIDVIAEDVFAVLEEHGLYRVILPGTDPNAVILQAGGADATGSDSYGEGQRGGHNRGG